MGENSAISWTDNTFNPWLGCVECSTECDNCYARLLVENRMGKNLWGKGADRRRTSPAYWMKPFRWNREAEAKGEITRVFCGSLMDVFEDHPAVDDMRPHLWELIRTTPFLHWLLLTKRTSNIERNLPPDWGEGWRNVWLGTSIGIRKTCHRAQILARIPARVHFLSLEPLLENISDDLDLSGIEWAIVGGESGPNFRPMQTQWARNLLALARRSGVSFFFKQSAAFRTEMGTTLDGQTIQEHPLDRTPDAATTLF
jgi:protein gp37